ncbi:acyl-CoA N-acyltransferase [Lindgomyces ingoldianus]|uniref:Acyl-CoA N-acyltransferase n=1 Tax=Lindgomyces ingoldianus TaxID=673940 RepID=A0ACB6QSV5_9PLEO|nr:acyl-CoA N-acyltransferase [Lindgomyces ingoldianus]KAF2469643.1 acyl-CoA N-acyltransferase [Lindgomyces ingoldianus]
MPRDLESEKATLEGMPPLSKESEAGPPDPTPLYFLPTEVMDPKFKKMKDLHPYSLLLNQEDLDECDWLEHVAFDPHEAASREKLDYRLHVCGELCTGIFTSSYATAPPPLGPLLRSRTFPGIDSSDSDRKKVLLGHIIATKHAAPLVTDASMDFPKDWRQKYQMTPSAGHNEDGQTICLHSLAIHPDFQGRGLGKVLLKGFTQRMRDSGVAKRVALICHERFVAFYEACGYRKVGPSDCTYAGGGWFDMAIDFEGLKDDPDF